MVTILKVNGEVTKIGLSAITVKANNNCLSLCCIDKSEAKSNVSITRNLSISSLNKL